MNIQIPNRNWLGQLGQFSDNTINHFAKHIFHWISPTTTKSSLRSILSEKIKKNLSPFLCLDNFLHADYITNSPRNFVYFDVQFAFSRSSADFDFQCKIVSAVFDFSIYGSRFQRYSRAQKITPQNVQNEANQMISSHLLPISYVQKFVHAVENFFIEVLPCTKKLTDRTHIHSVT